MALMRDKWVLLFSLQRAGHAAFDFGTFQRQLAQTDVIQRFDAFLPRVDLRFIDIARGGGIGEEQGQRQPLIDMARRLGVGVDDLLRSDFVSIINGAG